MIIDKEKNRSNIDPSNSKRAPLQREAPFPLKGPARRKGPRKPHQPQDIRSLFKKSGMQFDQDTGFQGGPSAKRKGYRLAWWSILASFIDALILISGSSLFLVSFSLIMKSSLGSMVGQALNQHTGVTLYTQVLLAFAWVYLIAVRSVMGSTIGEWACDLRLGQPHERLQTSYILRVVLRSTVILATGVVTLPILSMLFGKDIPGSLSGLKLFSLK